MKIDAELYKVTITESPSWQSTAEEYAITQKKFQGVPFVELRPYDTENSYNNEVLLEKELVLGRDQLLELSIRNIQFKVGQLINVGIDITQQLIALAEKPIKIITESGATQYNNKCEVHMPGHGLSLYNEMLLLEDACTDELQSGLNSGWRIVAACPQPEQRRPDYILGRFNPELENAGSAERKA